MFKLKSFALKVAIASVITTGAVQAASIESYLEGIEGISASDISSYLSKYEISEGISEAKDESPIKAVKKASPAKTKSISKESKPALRPATTVSVTSESHKPTGEDLSNLEDAISNGHALGNLFLRNVPQSSVLEFTERLLILPNETTAYFHKGKRVYQQPEFKEGVSTSFCMLSLSQSGKARKVAEGRELFINEVQEKNSIYTNTVRGTETLVRVSKLIIDNPDLKEVVCIGAGVSKPLAINDLLEATGGAVTIKTQEYTEI